MLSRRRPVVQAPTRMLVPRVRWRKQPPQREMQPKPCASDQAPSRVSTSGHFQQIPIRQSARPDPKGNRRRGSTGHWRPGPSGGNDDIGSWYGRALRPCPHELQQRRNCPERHDRWVRARFLSYAYRSLKEVVTGLELCGRLYPLLSQDRLKTLIDEGNRISKMTWF